MPSQTATERADDHSKPYLLYPPSESIAPEWNIDGWLSVPFHRWGILNPPPRSVLATGCTVLPAGAPHVWSCPPVAAQGFSCSSRAHTAEGPNSTPRKTGRPAVRDLIFWMRPRPSQCWTLTLRSLPPTRAEMVCQEKVQIAWIKSSPGWNSLH